jgi:hypothetical protein
VALESLIVIGMPMVRWGKRSKRAALYGICREEIRFVLHTMRRKECQSTVSYLEYVQSIG